MTGSLMIDPVVVWWIRLAIALLLASAAIHKLRDRAGFRAAFAAYRLLPTDWIAGAPAGLAALECVAAAALLVPATAHAGAMAGIVLLALYAAAIAINLVRGRRTIDCGCGGPGGARPIAPALVVRNLVLIGMLAWSLAPASARPLGWMDVVTVVFAVAASALVYSAVDVAIANAARLRGAGGLRWSTP